LRDATQNIEESPLSSLFTVLYLMDKYQTFSVNFLAKNAYSDNNGLKIFSNKIRKYNLAAEDGLVKT
jgi:hypothetical protein